LGSKSFIWFVPFALLVVIPAKAGIHFVANEILQRNVTNLAYITMDPSLRWDDS
jgi:hypothetical protein